MNSIPDHSADQDDILLSVRNVKKHYPIREGALQRVVGQVRAVDGVSFDIKRGETVGLVGESGCGKTTIGRVISGLTDATGGSVFYNSAGAGLIGIDNLQDQALRRFRRNCQMVFQDSFASLNPRHMVIDIVGRPLKVYKEATGASLTEQVVELLEQVGLARQHLYRYPHQFSGGQRQRISIARALALNPEIIVLDEPTSALDVSVQAQILNLLNDLQKERQLAYLFVTHDLSVVRHMADQLVVPDPARPPQGCRFHTRCSMATSSCGWEVDDVVGWLEDKPGIFEHLNGVSRTSAFEAELSFDTEDAAAELAMALRSKQVPDAMKTALKRLKLNGSRVHVAFEAVEEVQLMQRAGGRAASCLLNPAEIVLKRR
jgi:ABC-type oligopeptide transport system ATPase subunit